MEATYTDARLGTPGSSISFRSHGSGTSFSLTMRFGDLGGCANTSPDPIHRAFQSAGPIGPIVQRCGSLHAELPPFSSRIFTFHQHSIPDVSGFPAYSTWTDRSERTSPESQRPPWSRSSRSFVV